MAALLQDFQKRLQDPTIDYQTTLLCIALGVGAFEGYIGHRQKPFLSSVLHPTLPSTLKPFLPNAVEAEETYRKSQSYGKDKLSYASFIGRIDLLETVLLLSSVTAPVFAFLGLGSVVQSAFPWFGGEKGQWTLLKGFWDLAGGVPGASTELKQSLAFVALMTTLGTALSLPKEYYKNFVLEEKHGFNKTTKGIFVADQIKGFALSLALEIPIIAGILKIIEWVGAAGMLRIVAWIMAFILGFQLIMIPAYPYLIAPLFNTFTPLPADSPVFPLVKKLSERLDFPLGRIWVMDGSKRSSHSNAFFFGLPFLTKHIVIYDTLLEKSKPEEVEAILAHELGHYAGAHVLVLLLTSLLQTAFSLSTFTLFLSNRSLLASFGFSPSRLSSGGPTIISLLLAASLFSPMSSVLQFCTNGVTRKLEYDADAFAVKLGESYAKNLKGALVSIHEKNLALTGTDWIYSAYHNNHPTLIERLDALDGALADGKGKSKAEGKKDL